MVAARDHPLASVRSTIAKSELTTHVQLVLTDRSSLSEGREFGVMSPQTWRLADLFVKHAFLLNGLGWGGMPLHVVERDINEGRLVELSIEDLTSGGLIMPMSAVYPTSAPPGPAGRWLIEWLKRCPEQMAWQLGFWRRAGSKRTTSLSSSSQPSAVGSAPPWCPPGRSGPVAPLPITTSFRSVPDKRRLCTSPYVYAVVRPPNAKG